MKVKSVSQVFFGLLVVAVGIGFLLQSLGLYGFGSLAALWWPAVIIGVGVASWLTNPRAWAWPFLVVVFGVLLELQQLNILALNVWTLLWPTIIVVFGLSIIFGRTPIGRHLQTNDDEVAAFAVFSGQNLVNTSADFKGGSANAWFGGVKIDLRQAKVKANATLDISCAFGGVEVIVPDTWLVRASGLPLFGGWEDHTHKPADKTGAPVLTVRGTCMFGGYTVKN